MIKTEQLKTIFRQSLQRIANHKDWKQPSCIILSGGLDTSIVAEEGVHILSLQGAITTIATRTATDEQWAIKVAIRTGLEHHIVKTDLRHLLDLLPQVIRILKSFDPMELRNSLATFAALKQASSLGFRCCVTGDGADEIFGGYSFTHHLSEQDFVQHRNAMIANMHFSSFPMAQSLGLSVFSPYLDPEVIELAKNLTKRESIGNKWVNGKYQTFGKLLLRETFGEVTSCWRNKDPIEVGSGTTVLGNGYFEQWIDNQSFVQQVDEIWKRDGA
ncbi:asparagine synthase (glutamine-hydrolyzing) [Galdieria sulphuraria]|uniref:Asparagine synthase (Glutamine-hydrolysing) n=1 Tax=Galdieria sulphuraria TaxID=130081 RepID=M2WU79_GALSU|nr:asparagine synthase (glutamine-hydrolyzing) [Galdieria sulphuraria]EME27465.1 asparagine synthase (glutamine-hydrolysing) [Galdieria sulphuraria]|eukprot:XP_005703985.1 asparagine synthase (glutamine-hydrolysing) [Galdieria sulphuraria]